jgi:hypothetical protein
VPSRCGACSTIWDWSLPEDVASSGRRLLDYIRRIDLIPDEMPLMGHLDDALLVELIGEFAGLVQDYLDYRRFIGESHVRGTLKSVASSGKRLPGRSEPDHIASKSASAATPIEPLSRPFRVC